jgi:hypothetical protein
MRGRITFREEDKEGPVNSGQVNSAVEKGGEHLHDIGRDQVPEGREEGGSEPVGARAGLLVHIHESFFNLLRGENIAKGGRKDSAAGVELRQVEALGANASGAQEVGVVVLKDGGLLGVGAALLTIDN